MKCLFSFFVCLLFISACTSPEPQKEFTGDRQFRTTDPSRLYFNNIRSTDYYRNRKPGTRIDLYRHRKLSFKDDRPVLHPVIVNNWMKDEAYIFIEKNAYRNGWSDTLTVRWSQGDTLSGTYELPLGTRPAMYEFAGKIYGAMKDKQQLQVKDKFGNFTPILSDGTDRSAFQMVMRDYYKLTEVR